MGLYGSSTQKTLLLNRTPMAFRFEFDPANRILRCRFSEAVTEDELTYFYRMATLLAESLDPLAGLVDFSAVTSFKTNAEFMRKLAALPPIMPKTERIRVIVAPADQIFGLARLFEMQGKASRPNLHVVRSVREAWAILGVQEPEFRPIPEAFESRLGNPDSKSIECLTGGILRTSGFNAATQRGRTLANAKGFLSNSLALLKRVSAPKAETLGCTNKENRNC